MKRKVLMLPKKVYRKKNVLKVKTKNSLCFFFLLSKQGKKERWRLKIPRKLHAVVCGSDPLFVVSSVGPFSALKKEMSAKKQKAASDRRQEICQRKKGPTGKGPDVLQLWTQQVLAPRKQPRVFGTARRRLEAQFCLLLGTNGLLFIRFLLLVTESRAPSGSCRAISLSLSLS